MLLASNLLQNLASLIQNHKAALLLASELERGAGLYQTILVVVELCWEGLQQILCKTLRLCL